MTCAPLLTGVPNAEKLSKRRFNFELHRYPNPIPIDRIRFSRYNTCQCHRPSPSPRPLLFREKNSGRADDLPLENRSPARWQGFFVFSAGNFFETMAMQPRRIEIYDTTLRDGTQGEGFSLSLQDKLQIAQKLDFLGVDFIEGGFPLSNPKDAAFFREVPNLKLKTAKVAAFGMTRRRGMKAEEDPGMRALLDAQTPVITIVGKTSEFHVRNVLGVSLEENLAMISDTIRLLRSEGRQVIYDAEHFFDAFAQNRDYAMRTLQAAQDAGASVLALCDTNGGSLPEFVASAVAEAKKQISAVLGIHTHNDAALAVANAHAALSAGAEHVQGTINGVGERCGNMDLIPLIANLQLKYKLDCLRGGSL